MLDSLIKFGAMFNWITPLLTWLQDAANRPSIGYNVSVHGSWSAIAIERLLRLHGVKIWGLTIFGDVITFRARVAQAKYAQYLQERNGIHYVGGIQAPQEDRRPNRQDPST